MLQGVMKCGLGNWKGISEQYVKTKTPEDCEEHYFTFYYKSKDDNMPSEGDLIVQGPRQMTSIGNDMLEMAAPIDQVKSKQAEERVTTYRGLKELEKETEANELAQR